MPADESERLSPPLEADELTVERGVTLDLPDGVRLVSDVWRDGQEERPVLLLRTPYGRRFADPWAFAPASWYARHGFNVVLQDVRGRGESGGTFEPLRNEAEDGARSVEWAAQLEGSNGQVATYGYSYSGFTQLAAASCHPPSLCCIAPAMVSCQFPSEWLLRDGLKRQEVIVPWALHLALHEARRRADVVSAQLAADLLQRLDLRDRQGLDQARHAASGLPVAAQVIGWLDNPEGAEDRFPDPPVFDVPALVIGGWFDFFLRGSLALYEQALARNVPARLVLAPWVHRAWLPGYRDLHLGGPVDQDHELLRWFGTWTTGHALGSFAKSGEGVVWAPVFGEVRAEPHWPPPLICRKELWLSSGGRANSRFGDGKLATKRSERPERDETVFDPRFPPALFDPLPDRAEADSPLWPAPQVMVQDQREVLVYTSEPADEQMLIAGRVQYRLEFEAEAPAELVVDLRLHDVAPDGLTLPITGTTLRIKGRCVLRGDLYPVGWLLRSGHRLRLTLSPDCVADADSPERLLALARCLTVHHGPETDSMLVIEQRGLS